MTTVRDLINGSLRLLGAIATGEAMSSAEGADGLLALNGMVDSWNTERLMVYTINRLEFNLVAGQQLYTMGTGGNFNTTRPTRIDQAYLKITATTPNLEIPLHIVQDEGWAAIGVKSITSTYPTTVYSDGSFPLSNVYVWPVPTQVNVLVLYVWNQISQFATLDDAISFPPGYLEALRYSLACRLAPEFGLQASPWVLQEAVASKARIKVINQTPVYLTCDESVLARPTHFNWITGDTV